MKEKILKELETLLGGPVSNRLDSFPDDNLIELFVSDKTVAAKLKAYCKDNGYRCIYRLQSFLVDANEYTVEALQGMRRGHLLLIAQFWGLSYDKSRIPEKNDLIDAMVKASESGVVHTNKRKESFSKDEVTMVPVILKGEVDKWIAIIKLKKVTVKRAKVETKIVNVLAVENVEKPFLQFVSDRGTFHGYYPETAERYLTVE